MVKLDIGKLIFYSIVNDIANGILDICQFEESIKRLIGQLAICQEIIDRVAFDNLSPEDVWQDCMRQLYSCTDHKI